MINNAKRWAPRGAWRYGVALAAALAAFGARQLLHPFLEAHMPALFFTIAAVLVGFSLGIWPAIVVVIVGVPIADYFFVPPYANFGYFDKEDVILFIGFPSLTLLFLVMIEWLRRTQHEARLLGEVAKSRYDMLVRAEQRRRQAETAKSVSHRLLRQFTDEHADVLYVGRVGSRYEYLSQVLEAEFEMSTGDTPTERLMAALSSADAGTLAAALNTPDDSAAGVWPLRLPRRGAAGADLACQLERFPTEHGAYLVVKILREEAA